MADPNGGTYAQRLEARRIEASAGVIAGSLDLTAADGAEVLEFGIASEPTVNAPAADIREVERISFVYRDGRRFGETAPSHVLCLREDFPRDLVHLCSGRPGAPAAPCLAIAGLQPLYERTGIEAILERLRKFLRDAKTGTLTAGGWEPVPFSIDQKPCAGEVIPHVFQNHAHGNLADGCALGMAINFEEEKGRYVVVFPQILKLQEMVGALGHHNQNGKRRAVPWIFLWPSTVTPEAEPIFADWRSGAELYEGMRRIGVHHAFDAAVGALLEKGVDFRCAREPHGGKGLIVVLGVWRPEPIMREFFGYSDNEEARKLELRAFRISQDLGKEIVAEDTTVETIVGDYPASPELFRWVAGVDPTAPVALIGMGALGSAVFNHLARSGLDDVVVYDDDVARPHNLARHTGRAADLYQPKSDQASDLLHALARAMSVQFVAHSSNVVDLTLDELAQGVKGRLVIDATADERVRVRMEELQAQSDCTVVRTEMFHEGRLGATFVAPPGGPTLTDMTRALFTAAPDDQDVAAWLEYEERHPLGPSPLLAGFGCTSQTVHLPLHAVEQHASVATATILGDRAGPGISINPLDERFRPTGWRWLPVPPFTTFAPPNQGSWSVRIWQPALDRIVTTRAEALPSETGGYLYGAWDPLTQVITITVATTLPPDSVASPTSLQLGPAGATAEERRLVRKARGRIYLCGTWHSHPGGSARMSGRDYTTMMGHHVRDAQTLSPTLVVIAADGEIQAHLKLP